MTREAGVRVDFRDARLSIGELSPATKVDNDVPYSRNCGIQTNTIAPVDSGGVDVFLTGPVRPEDRARFDERYQDNRDPAANGQARRRRGCVNSRRPGTVGRARRTDPG